MKTKTADLTGPALDWAVGTALELPVEIRQIFQYGRPNGKHYISIGETDKDGAEVDFEPSEEWSQGGPLIDGMMEGEFFFMENDGNDNCHVAYSTTAHSNFHGYGPTPLIAATRCFCCAKLGDEIEIPQELQLCQQPNL